MLRRTLAIFSLALLSPFAVVAEVYPDRPIKMLIGFTAGGGADLYGRAVAAKMSKLLGQPFVVENKPGAAETIAATLLARSKPDGYTVMMGSPGMSSMSVIRPAEISYRMSDSFTYVGLAFVASAGIIVSRNSAINSLEDLRRESTSRSVKIAYAGAGGPSQVAIEIIKARTGINFIAVPYQGMSSALPDILAGRVDGYAGTYPALKPMIDMGKMKIAVLSAESRVPQYPNVKTFRESGVDLVQLGYWGIYAPAGLSPAIASRLSQALSETLKDPDIKSFASGLGLEIRDLPQQKFRQFVADDLRMYEDALSADPNLVKLLGVR